MKEKDITYILKLFFSWRILVFVFIFLAIKFIPLQKDFLGGGMGNYVSNPVLWSLANFDGEHYLSIAQKGYEPLTYFFFPLYPLLVKALAIFSSKSLFGYLISGIFISNLSFLIALLGLYKLVSIDQKDKISKLTILLLILFPTSFFFGSFYTESLFLALVVWSFYFARKEKWVLAGILAGLSTATRIIGLALVIALLVEYFTKNKKKLFKKELLLFPLSILGILLYMYFLKTKTGDPFEFFNTVSIFGEQRSTGFILFPQVFYRYIFKILPNLNYSYFPSVFVSWLEFLTAFIFLLFSVLSFFKLRLSYAVYLSLGFIIPAFSGSFSSLPRYALVLFPGFILSAIYIKKAPRLVQILSFSILFVVLGIATAMFSRGFWIS